MIKVIQIGEGNFLRTFVDAYFDSLNKEGVGEYEVHIVKPIPHGNLDNFKKQNNKYIYKRIWNNRSYIKRM